jgi:hypothetical protein
MIQSFTALGASAPWSSRSRLGIRSPLAIQALVLSDAPAVDVLAGAATGLGRHSHSETR